MKMKIAVASSDFIPDEDFNDFLSKIGVSDVRASNFMYNQVVVDYIERNANWHPYHSRDDSISAIKGATSWKYRVGFSGTASVLTVDTSKPWIIRWDNSDSPFIYHIDYKVCKDEYNQVSVISKHIKKEDI